MEPIADKITKILGSKKHCFNPLVDDQQTIPDKHGLYAICITNKDALPVAMKDIYFNEIDGYLVLYLGISASQSLHKRDYKNHFTGSARNSTVRKSLGSLWGWEKYRNYGENRKYSFDKKREDEITKWMHENAFMFYWVANDDTTELGKIEKRLIKEISPPLNIQYNHSPINKTFRGTLREARKPNIP